MPDLPASPTQQLLDIKLDGCLDHFVRSRREQRKSWRRITLDIRDATGIEITHETLRSWYPDERVAS